MKKFITFIIAQFFISSVAFGVIIDQTGSPIAVFEDSPPVGVVGQDLYIDISVDKELSSADVASGTAYCWNFSETGSSGVINEQCSGSNKSMTVSGVPDLDFGLNTEGLYVRNKFRIESVASSSDVIFDNISKFNWCSWVYRDDYTNQYGAIVSKYHHSSPPGRRGWHFSVEGNGLSFFNTWDDEANENEFHGTDKALAGWNHICFTYEQSSTTVVLYMNGVVDGGGTITITPVATGDDFVFGEYGNSAFIGNLDGAVWQTGLIWDQAQITVFYKAGLKASLHGGVGHIWSLANEPGTDSSEVVAYYKFASGALTTDEQSGAFTLTNNTITFCSAGITGSNYCADFDGASWFNQADILDPAPAALAIDLWMRMPDGNPPGNNQVIFKNMNTVAINRIGFNVNSVGQISTSSYLDGTSLSLQTGKILNDGPTKWHYVVYTWDTINGQRIFVNGSLAAQRSDTTTLPQIDTGETDLLIGRYTSGSYFSGQISLLRFRDKILSQNDIDQGYVYGAAHILGSAGVDAILKGYEKRANGVQTLFDVNQYERATNSINYYLDLSSFDAASQIVIKN